MFDTRISRAMPTRRPAPPITPRKQPVQARSKLTVQAILEGTAQVLVQLGYDGTTTGAVAERAGVSIGTLYQYFPNKEALVAGLMGKHVDEVVATVASALAASRGQSLDGVLRAVVRAGLDAHRLDPALHKVISEQVPRKGQLAEALNISQQLSDMLFAHLVEVAPEVPRERMRLVSFVLETTIEALTHRAVIESPAWLRTGQLETEALAALGPYLLDAVGGNSR